MALFDNDFIKAVAHGDEKATELVSKLSPSEKISLGMIVEETRERENIVPMNNGFSVYQKEKSAYVDDEAVREAIRTRMEREQAERERQQKIQEEYIAEQTRLAIERSRAGLRRNDKLSVKQSIKN